MSNGRLTSEHLKEAYRNAMRGRVVVSDLEWGAMADALNALLSGAEPQVAGADEIVKACAALFPCESTGCKNMVGSFYSFTCPTCQVREKIEALKGKFALAMESKPDQFCFECDDKNRCASAEKCYALHVGFPRRQTQHYRTESKLDEPVAGADEQKWRELLWLNHARYVPHMPYGDDGEMQCCGIDFKRWSAQEIHDYLSKRAALSHASLGRRERSDTLGLYGPEGEREVSQLLKFVKFNIGDIAEFQGRQFVVRYVSPAGYISAQSADEKPLELVNSQLARLIKRRAHSASRQEEGK